MQLSQIQQATTPYLLEVEVQVEDSQEAEAVVASVPSKKPIANLKLCYNRGQKKE